MKLTGELLTKARTAKSPEELITIADKMGATISDDEAAYCYHRLHTEPELSEEELEAVTGGSDDNPCKGYFDYQWDKPCLHGRPDTIWKSDCEEVYGCKNWRYRRYILDGVEMLDATCWHWTLERPDKDTGYTG
ncbi:MAG: hypothetical protein LBL98_08470 [Ruminococcus sp.]|jgi:hypothetical protein|nr:hypothetical protein [Ruminococcus sp.]